MKKIIILIIVVYSLLLIACSINSGSTASDSVETVNASTTNTTEQPMDVVLTVDSTADFSHAYRTDVERFNDPDVVAVIEGEVVSANYIYIEHILSTMSLVKVNAVYKGDIKAGDTISILERGGYAPYEVFYVMEIMDKWPDIPVPKKTGVVEELFCGCKVMQPKERVILYLVKGQELAKEVCMVTENDDPHQRGECPADKSGNMAATALIEGQFYFVAGTVQGKMVFQNGVYKMQLPQDWIDVENKDFTLPEFNTFVETVKKGE